jgi:DNA-binding MarR family transcriptional regulator
MAVAKLRKKYSPGEGIKMLDSPDVSFGPASFGALDLFLADLDRSGITLKGLHLLIHLRNAGDDLKRLSALASAIGVTGAGITGVADQLEDKGLAVRVIQRHDRRSIYLTLTPKGSKFVNWVAAALGGALGAPAS